MINLDTMKAFNTVSAPGTLADQAIPDLNQVDNHASNY